MATRTTNKVTLTISRKKKNSKVPRRKKRQQNDVFIMMDINETVTNLFESSDGSSSCQDTDGPVHLTYQLFFSS